MTDLKVLRQIVKMMVDHGLTEVDLEAEGEKIKLKRGPGGDVQLVAPAAPPAGAPAPSAAPAAAPAEPADSGDDDGGSGETIDSPMVGTFYSAGSPDADAFVKVGDTISPDTVVCIIEAMKVFNEIKAEASGTVAEVMVTSGQAVEFGQPLFRLK